MEQATPQPQPIEQVVTTNSATAPVPSNSPTSSNSLLIGVIVLIVMVTGGLVFYIFTLKSQTITTVPVKQINQGIIVSPTSIPSAITAQSQDEIDVDSIQVDTTTSEFDEINLDLREL